MNQMESNDIQMLVWRELTEKKFLELWETFTSGPNGKDLEQEVDDETLDNQHKSFNKSSSTSNIV